MRTRPGSRRSSASTAAPCSRRLSAYVGWAEDVVQETSLRAWRRWEHMTPEHGSVRGWLMRVAHNMVMDRYRSARMLRGEMTLDEAREVARVCCVARSWGRRVR
ncbi:MAG TPA: sigma factor [Pseudonocardiaceae bacterium]|nr:sigma factor [Pseudonocardiaceae bacterium]